MSNDEKIKNLSKRIDNDLSYSESLPEKKHIKINKNKLKELAKDIRKYVEDDPIEANSYTRLSHYSK